MFTTPSASFPPRGVLSAAVLDYFVAPDPANLEAATVAAISNSTDILHDEDIQLALFVLYASVYGSLPELNANLEWDLDLIGVRRHLEREFERHLRDRVQAPVLPEPDIDSVAAALFDLVAADVGPSLSRFMAKKASPQQAQEFMKHRSIYTLREADPHSWAIPRLTGRAKAALVEIQSDEYGGGRPDRVHAQMFARSVEGVGLDPRYGAYLHEIPAITLASMNMMSMFGLNRRFIGAIVGHLAAFEMTSSIPNRLYGDGMRRLGFGAEVTDYFDEHVEADAVHEQIAARDLAGSLVVEHPGCLPDIMFGAASCLTVDAMMGAHMLDAWQRNESSLLAGVLP